MSVSIVGNSGGNVATVDGDRRLHTEAVQRTDDQEAAIKGEAFTIGPPAVISLTTATISGVLYFVNNETNRKFEFVKLVLSTGTSTGGAATTPVIVTIHKNVTTGTIVSGGTSLTPSNKNFGKSTTVSSTATYGTGAALTTTDGSVHEVFQMPQNDVREIEFDDVLETGKSIAISVTAPTSNTALPVIATLHGHLENEKEAQ